VRLVIPCCAREDRRAAGAAATRREHPAPQPALGAPAPGHGRPRRCIPARPAIGAESTRDRRSGAAETKREDRYRDGAPRPSPRTARHLSWPASDPLPGGGPLTRPSTTRLVLLGALAALVGLVGSFGTAAPPAEQRAHSTDSASAGGDPGASALTWVRPLLALATGAPVGGASTRAAAELGAPNDGTAREAGAAAPRVRLSVDSVHYRVLGTSANALREQMRQLGPTDRFGRWAASTRWDLKWSYPYDRADGGCRSGPVSVDLAVTFTLPRWDAPADAPAELVERWDRYVAALSHHEEGHRDIAVDAANEIAGTIEAVPAHATCRQFERAADTAARSVVERYRGLQIAYDDATGHGATQGAVLR
jgi:predicted secreted Zn-dependent protease